MVCSTQLYNGFKQIFLSENCFGESSLGKTTFNFLSRQETPITIDVINAFFRYRNIYLNSIEGFYLVTFFVRRTNCLSEDTPVYKYHAEAKGVLIEII